MPAFLIPSQTRTLLTARRQRRIPNRFLLLLLYSSSVLCSPPDSISSLAGRMLHDQTARPNTTHSFARLSACAAHLYDRYVLQPPSWNRSCGTCPSPTAPALPHTRLGASSKDWIALPTHRCSTNFLLGLDAAAYAYCESGSNTNHAPTFCLESPVAPSVLCDPISQTRPHEATSNAHLAHLGRSR